jgi:hypothetical protein
VDTANPWFIPIGSLAHFGVDIVGGNLWWNGGIPVHDGTTEGANYPMLPTVKALISILLIICLAWMRAAPTPPESVSPIWSAEVLRQQTGASKDRNLVASIMAQMSPHNTPGVIFLDDARLIVYEVEPTGKLSSRENPDSSSAFELHASVIDAATGTLLFTKDWGARSHDSSIQVTTGGILVRTDDVLRILASDFTEIRRLTFPDSSDRHDPMHCDRRIISVSPTRKTLMLNCYNTTLHFSLFDVWDGSTFRQMRAWSEAPLVRYSISDVGIATADRNQQHVLFSEFGTGRWESVGRSFEVGCVSLTVFLNINVLAKSGCNELSLLTVEGKVLMTDHPEIRETLGDDKIAVAQGGAVLAASLTQGKGGGFFDTDVRRTRMGVAVYNSSLKKRVLTVNVAPMPKNDYDFALSPDGSKLAILNDRKVSVYSVPVLPTADPPRTPEHER